MTVKSLRSLCLLQASSMDKKKYKDLPTGLVKDLNLMKVFNGNYSFESETRYGSDVHHTALTILYDGVSWSFTSRSQSHHVYCCVNCDIYQPSLHQFAVTEGEVSTATSPFSQVRDWLRAQPYKEHNDNKVQKVLDMKFTVELVEEDGTFGEIAFRGAGPSVLFSSIIQVDFASEGVRVLSHRGAVTSGMGTRNFFNNLYESKVSAEDSYYNYNSHNRCEIEEDKGDWSDWESYRNWSGSYDWTDEYDYFGEDEIHEDTAGCDLEMEELMEGFKQFWQFIENGDSVC